MRTSLVCLLLLLAAACAYAVAPVVSNVVARQRTDGSGKVDITYNLSDSDSGTVYVSVEVSTDGGSNYSTRSYVTGHVGWVKPGSARKIVWYAKSALGLGAVFASCKARVTADDSGGGVYPGQMIYIPAGSFLMGNSGVGNDASWGSYAGELPQHSVYLYSYWIGKHEVTRGEYRAFMEAGGYSNPAFWSSDGWNWRVTNNRTEPHYWAANQDWEGGQPFAQTDSHPVVGVSYYEATAFCNWAGGHLPTEAQWEKAARWDGHPRVYPSGDPWRRDECNSASDGLYDSTSPVGAYALDVSPYGCMDMTGNASEWCRDWFGESYYSEAPPGGWIDPEGPSAEGSRVSRGGNWCCSAGTLSYYVCHLGYAYRCAYRGNRMPHWDRNDLGFRLAR